LAEEEHFTDFNNTEKFIWHETDLKFGNWTDGPQMDGSRSFSTIIQASEVKKVLAGYTVLFLEKLFVHVLRVYFCLSSAHALCGPQLTVPSSTNSHLVVWDK